MLRQVAAQVPLAGSPFDLFTATGAGGGAGAGGQAANTLLSQLPNPLQILGQGNTLEKITTMARNLLQMTNGNQELLSTLTKAIGGGGGGSTTKLTSSAVNNAPSQKLISSAVIGEKLAATTTTNGTIGETKTEKKENGKQPVGTLFNGMPKNGGGNGSSTTTTTTVMSGQLDNKQHNGTEMMTTTATDNATLAMLNNLPLEQRTLLEAALRNGELEPEQAVKFIALENVATEGANNNSAAVQSNNAGQSQSNQKRLINSESRLMEWIQQNRPRLGHMSSSSSAIDDPNKGAAPAAAKNESAAKKDGWSWAAANTAAAADKLPYFGRYCGSFVEQQTNSTNPTAAAAHHIGGAVWAVDERRLLVTKFHFQPLDSSENITFWAGPAKLTGTSADFFPSENGIFLAPELLGTQAFSFRAIQRMEARIRKAEAPTNSPTNAMSILPPSSNNNNNKDKVNNETMPSSRTLNPAERDEDEEDDEIRGNNLMMAMAMQRRAKRNLYSELYGGENNAAANVLRTQQQQQQMSMPTPATTVPSFGGTSSPAAIVPLHFGGTAHNFHLSLGAGGGDDASVGAMGSSITQVGGNGTSIPMSADGGGGANTLAHRQQHHHHMSSSLEWQSLGWYGTGLPLLLTLPTANASRMMVVKNINWLAVWDHVQKQALAMVLIPTSGAVFQAPSTVQLRPFPSSPSSLGAANTGLKQLQSGPIRVIDTKTIEVTEFTLRSDGLLPTWFMVGKEIMPNANGHIVPLLDRSTNTFDCNSLRDFHNETVTLRLPDPLDIKDVFWFSVFSIPRRLPLSHIYIPYNDMQLPPDLLGLSTPQCIWNEATAAGAADAGR